MAESYSCKGQWVHFSNSACQTIQFAWAKIADHFIDKPAMNELSESLKEISKYATGGAAVGIDDEYLDEPFSRIDVKKAWLKTMSVLIEDIGNGGPVSKDMDVNWDDELRNSWLERLIVMRDCLKDQIKT